MLFINYFTHILILSLLHSSHSFPYTLLPYINNIFLVLVLYVPMTLAFGNNFFNGGVCDVFWLMLVEELIAEHVPPDLGRKQVGKGKWYGIY